MPAWWSTVLPGDTVVLWYSDDSVGHEALILWRFGSYAVIYTPDSDRYVVEIFGNPADGPADAKQVSRDGQLPPLSKGVYRFRSYPNGVDYKNLLRAARAEPCRGGPSWRDL